MEAAERLSSWTSNDVSAERHVPRLVEPEVLLPSQYFELLTGHSILEGEKRLMLAILEDAVSCFQKYESADRGRNKRLFEEAAEWIFEDEGGWVFSFESVCDALGIDSHFLRNGLQRWREHRGDDAKSVAKFSRVRLRAARRHKILPFRERRRRPSGAPAVA